MAGGRMNDCACNNVQSFYKVVIPFFLEENANSCAFEIKKKLGYKDVTVEEHSI